MTFQRLQNANSTNDTLKKHKSTVFSRSFLQLPYKSQRSFFGFKKKMLVLEETPEPKSEGLADENAPRHISDSEIIPDTVPLVTKVVDNEDNKLSKLRSTLDMDTVRIQTANHRSFCRALDLIVQNHIPEAATASCVYGMSFSFEYRLIQVHRELKRLGRQVPIETRKDLSERLDEFLHTLGDNNEYEIAELGMFILSQPKTELQRIAAELGESNDEEEIDEVWYLS